MVRSATPGTLLVLTAAVLLGIVTVSTPIIKSIYFLRATIGGRGNQNGQTATFGTLGYCIGNTCSPATLGYKFDPNQLLGINAIPSNYTSIIIKGLTYTLILHPVALAFAVIAFVIGLLAHCREMSLTCLTSCFSSIGAFLALVAFGLDLALFVIAKKRIDSVDGASAQLGIAIWLTLAAWILLILGGCAFSCGVCSSRRRSRNRDDYGGGYGKRPYNPPYTHGPAPGPAPAPAPGPATNGTNYYADQMRMDALQAEADRKRRENAGYGGNALPKFAEYETEHEVPLKNDYEDGAYRNTTQHAPIPIPAPLPVAPVASSSHVPGVGPGYGPRQPSTTSYAAVGPAMDANAAGHGAHAQYASSVVSPTMPGPTMPAPMLSVSPPPAEPMYTPGVGPQPYRDGLEHQSSSGAPPHTYSSVDYEPSGAYVTSPVQEDPYSSVAAVTSQASMRRHNMQNTADYGHPTEYSGATFGGVGHAAQPSAAYDHRAPPSEGGGSRLRGPGANMLPPVPDEYVRSPEIEYVGGAVDTGAGSSRRLDVNDGFGITTQNNNNTGRSDAHSSNHDDGYDNYASSAYAHTQSKTPTQYEDVHEPPPHTFSSGLQTLPPGYENTHNAPYPPEKQR